MSIASQIRRISDNVSAALRQIANKGVTVPQEANSDNLAELIDEITVYDDVEVTPGVDAQGIDTYMTAGTAADHDVTVTPIYSNPNGHVAAHTDEPGDPEYYKIRTANPAFNGGALSSKNAAATATRASISASVNNSGVELQTTGGATRGAVEYSIAAEGWIEKDAGDTAMAAGTAESWNGTKYYINGVVITPAAGSERSFIITLPNGANATIDLTFTVEAEGNWSIE